MPVAGSHIISQKVSAKNTARYKREEDTDGDGRRQDERYAAPGTAPGMAPGTAPGTLSFCEEVSGDRRQCWKGVVLALRCGYAYIFVNSAISKFRLSRNYFTVFTTSS